MNEIILTEQPLIFVSNDTFGLYSWVTDTVMFTFVAGEQYTVTWDGTAYTCTAAEMTLGALSGVGLGNAGIVGGENTGEPFIFAYLPEYSQNAAFSTDTETATHTVSIAKSGAEPDTPTLGTDIVLYDRTGQAVVYRGIETITTDKPETDEKATFTHGVPVDDAEVTLDLAGGDQQFAAPAGHVIRAATIKKPMTLEPKNIKKGVNVAGVVGSFAGEETEKTVALSMADGDQVIEADDDTVMKKVTVTKPATLVPENIASGVEIGGVVGTLSGGGDSDYFTDDEVYDDVRFYDMDGSIVSRLSIAEANALTALPVPPAHEGFTFQEWNHTLSEVQGTTRPLDIGANYITSDGKTVVCVYLNNVSGTSTLSYYVESAGNGLKVYSGNVSQTVTSTGNKTINVSVGQEDTVITFEPSGDCKFYIKNFTAVSGKVGTATINETPTIRYANVGIGYTFGYAIESGGYENIPTGITSIEIANMLRSKYCHIPRTVTSVTANPNTHTQTVITTYPNSVETLPATFAFYSIDRAIFPDVELNTISIDAVYSRYVVLPKKVGSITKLVVNKAVGILFPENPCTITYITSYALREIIIPENITVNSSTAASLAFFRNCNSLKRVKWENTMTSLNKMLYYNCPSLQNPSFPSGITSISTTGMFSGCSALKCVVIPEGSTNTGGLNSDLYALQLLVLPSTVTQIASSITQNTFYSLQAVVCLAETPPTNFRYLFCENTAKCTWNVYVPDSSLTTYAETLISSGWTSYVSRLKPISEYPGGFSLDKL